MVLWDLLVCHLRGLCCVVFLTVFHDNELIVSAVGKRFYLVEIVGQFLPLRGSV